MAEAPKIGSVVSQGWYKVRQARGLDNDEVYKVDQNSGSITYQGKYRGRGGESLRNSIRTVGARQQRRLSNAFRAVRNI